MNATDAIILGAAVAFIVAISLLVIADYKS